MRSVVNTLIKPASGLCNMECKYCFYCDEMSKRQQGSRGFMTEDTLKNVIEKTMVCASKCASFAFQGGEPTLRGLDFYQRVIEYQNQYNKNKIMVRNLIQTNGYILDEKWCRFFAENNFLVGISIDGTKEIHDSLRLNKEGQGTYEQIIQAISILEKFNVEYNILTVVTKYVADNIIKIYEDYKRKGWKYQQYIPCLDPYGMTGEKRDYSLSPEKYGDFLINLFQLWYEDVKNNCQPYIRQFENYAGIILGYQPEACNQSGICSIQNVVEADGSVYPCDFYAMDKYILGNFNMNSLVDIQKKAVESGFVQRSLALTKECRECRYFSLCRGGCQRNRILSKQGNVYHNYYCESYKRFFDRCIGQLIELINCTVR